MMVRTVETTVAFKHPFRLISAETILPAAVYRFVTDEEEIPGLYLCRLPAHTRPISVLHGDKTCLSITQSDLDAALTKDRQETNAKA